MEEWGNFLMAWQMVVRDHYMPISTGKPLAAQTLSRVVAGWLADQGGVVTAVCCTDLRYVRRLTACSICSDVDLACATSGSVAVTVAGAAAPEGVSPGTLEEDNR